MDQLPQELVDRISSYLSVDDLKNTLLLSHAFRFPAEKYSGAFTTFALNENNAEKFIGTFSGHRLLYLRDLKFGICLPRPEDNERRDDADQLSKHDKSFTQQITFLFKTMKTVEDLAGNHNKPGTVRLAISPPRRPIFAERSLSYHDHLSWRVHLLEPEALPLLESVRSLEVGDDWDGSFGGRAEFTGYNSGRVKLDYRVMVDLVVKLPNLEYWGCRTGGNEWSPKTEQEATKYLTQDWAGPRRDTRQDFAKALLSARLPGSLQRIRLDFLHDLDESTQIDHFTAQPDLVSPAANDLFSTSLHHLSHHLRRLHLRVVADETLFWPKDNCTPSWPNLESFIVTFHMVNPSGQWYFIGPNGEGRDTAAFNVTNASYPPLETNSYDEEMDWQIQMEGDRRYRGNENSRMRIVPNDTTLRPFLVAFAKATSNMKALQEAMLWCPLAWAPDDYSTTDWLQENCQDADKLAWGVHYQAKGEPNVTRQGERVLTEVPMLWWKAGKWRPDPELHELFQQIGRTSWGDGVEEHWEDEYHGDGLVDRGYFEYCALEEVDKVGRIPPPN
ncbi:hypothetical protein CC77DRAFT_1036077 [Alternaria alternata]|jgi:hypothetical protein|uniref:F-box domain-containing protein n=3 Tax=Alternaria sect. Alternaria TaxID=2499237 RepID=A0A177D2V3_ALTAL|nr:hypothetical protein CC77DRAFT_1036077 [Alternaria alternata]OAG13768.1 hypothetical protein CC77DRAFT_1036077 [Alternaria alternata]RII14913.1 hypothetical protein CUC08_Gglean003837 [Alternaria sp. MG1]RYN18173.1 hypothetical protein AA0115_g11466 [Alternaria tenuissima]